MVVLAKRTAQDSRTMRIATVVAMLYLPANLVMVSLVPPLSTKSQLDQTILKLIPYSLLVDKSFFSSNLVEFNKTSSSGQEDARSTGIFVHRQIWIATLTILVLTSLTLLLALYYDRKERGRRRSSTA